MSASTNITPETAAATQQSRLTIALCVLAGLVTLSALSDFPSIFYERDHTEPLIIFAQTLTNAWLAIAPLIAGTALVFAFMGRVRHAIVMLAALILVRWLTELPSIAIHGWELSADYGGVIVAIQRFLYPVIAVAAIVFAVKNRRLWLATVFVSLPTAVAWAGVLIFAIGVSIYGF